MICYRNTILNDKHDTPSIDVFNDEIEVRDFVEKMKIESSLAKKGRMEKGYALEVELQGNEIHAVVLFDPLPSFIQWRCESCHGRNDRCQWCEGKGWSLDKEPNSHGAYLIEWTYENGITQFMLVQDYVWEEIEEDGG